MFTSYFARLAKIKNPLSISGKAPDWYTGPQFKVLAPKISFFKDYKAGIIDSVGYTEKFKELVLSPLNAQDVYSELTGKYGDDVTLLCYEKPGDFCHRRLVANWFESELGVVVPELTF